MRTGTRVRTVGEDRTGTVTDTGCAGQVVWVRWDDTEEVTGVEQVEDGEWWDPESEDVVTERWG